MLSEKAGQQLGLPAGIAVGSGVIDAYAGWVGTVGAKVNLGADQLDSGVPKNDMSQAFSRLAAVAGTSRSIVLHFTRRTGLCRKNPANNNSSISGGKGAVAA